MAKIIKPGNYFKFTNICPYCECLYEYDQTEATPYDVGDCFTLSRGNINCPYCGCPNTVWLNFSNTYSRTVKWKGDLKEENGE